MILNDAVLIQNLVDVFTRLFFNFDIHNPVCGALLHTFETDVSAGLVVHLFQLG